MSTGRRRILLAGGVAAALAAVYFTPESDAVIEPVETRQRQRAAAPAGRGDGQGAHVLTIRPRTEAAATDADDTRTGLTFAARVWTPLPAPSSVVPLAASAPPPPQAPPLPFRYLGRYSEAGRDGVFLQHNDLNLVVHVGDTIADTYKVERLDSIRLTLRYLPLGESQVMDFGVPD